MLHYACLFKKNSCRLYTYSGKFPSLKRLCSGYGGKFCHNSLNNCDNLCRKYSRYLRQKIICKSRGTVPIHWGKVKHYMYLRITRPPAHILARSIPPGCQVSYTKNWTKLFGNLVCEIRRWIPSSSPPPHAGHGCTPHSSRQGHAVLATRNNFSSYLRKAFLWASMANP